MAVPIDLAGTSAIVFGVANHRSIAWAIAQQFHAAGARLTVTYQNERLGRTVLELVREMDHTQAVECDVLDEASVASAIDAAAGTAPLTTVAHCIAFANKDDLSGDFSATGIEGFRLALEVSAYSLLPVARIAAGRMGGGGSIMTLSFHAADKVYPGYNVMGVAKAALENEVKQLASDLGRDNVRVNAISAGPLDTISSRVISKYRDMKRVHAERSPMGRNITTDEVAKTALYLCSDLASGVTGEVLHVDTGYNIMGI